MAQEFVRLYTRNISGGDYYVYRPRTTSVSYSSTSSGLSTDVNLRRVVFNTGGGYSSGYVHLVIGSATRKNSNGFFYDCYFVDDPRTATTARPITDFVGQEIKKIGDSSNAYGVTSTGETVQYIDGHTFSGRVYDTVNGEYVGTLVPTGSTPSGSTTTINSIKYYASGGVTLSLGAYSSTEYALQSVSATGGTAYNDGRWSHDMSSDAEVIYNVVPKFTVAFNANGGTGTMSDQSFTYGVANSLSRCTFAAPSLYAFNGWNTSADGSGTAYEDQADGSELTDTPGGTVTLYAQWRFVGFNLTATRSPAVGTLALLKNGVKDYDATWDGTTLSYTGAADGSTYKLVCEVNGNFPFQPMTISPQSGETLNVVFQMSFHEIQLAASPDGSLGVTSPAAPDYVDSGTAKYAAGRNVTVKATPSAGRKVQKFLIENIDTHETYERTQFNNNEITLSNIGADYRVTAVYELIDYSLSASVDTPSAGAFQSESVSVTVNTAHYDDTVTFTARMEDGYEFEGWYKDGEKIDGALATYSPVVHSNLDLVAKAKVAVSLAIDAEEGTSATLTVNGEEYEPDDTPVDVDVVLGDTLSFALVIGTDYFFDAWYSVIGSNRVLAPYDFSDTITPTANTSLVAVVAASAPQRSATFDIRNEDGGASIPAALGDVTIVPAPESSEVDDGKLVFTYTGTKKVRVTCAASISGRGLSEPVAFTKAVMNGADYSENCEFDLVVNGKLELTLLYGSAGTRSVTVGYADGSDMTMGEILADGGTEPVEKTRGQTVAIFAAPKNGYVFVGWFSSPTSQGEPLFDGASSVDYEVLTNVWLYAQFARNNHSICEWEGEETPKALVWRSKTYAASKPFNPSACRVDALGYRPKSLLELTVDMFSAPDAAATASTTLTNIVNQDARRLPVRRMERYMQVEVKSTSEVDALLVGTSMGGLAT